MNIIAEDVMTVEESNLVTRNDIRWIIDSGATSHMNCDRSDFSSYRSLTVPSQVTFGNNDSAQVIGMGDVRLVTLVSGHSRIVILKDYPHTGFEEETYICF